jgi:large subunit ribosomal protein L21
MFAILETGSKQYKVEEGDILEVELLDKDKISEDNSFDFDSVLLLKDEKLHVGQPFVKNALVSAKVLEEFKAPKVIVFKKKSKKQYRKTRGHRQSLHRILIEKIGIGTKAPEKPAAKPKAEAAKETTAKTVAKPKAEAAKETKAKAVAKPKAVAKEPKAKTAAKPKAVAKPKTTTKAKAEPKPKAEKKVEKKEKE